jgi:hypothetical protein
VGQAEKAQHGAVADALPHHLIIRPRLRIVLKQLFVLLGLFSCIAAAIQLRAGPLSTLRISVLLASLVLTVIAYAAWFHKFEVRAIVVADGFLGITLHGRKQQRIPWSSVFSAVHSTGHLGMQWKLETLSAGTIILRDIRIDGDRWGALRAVIIDMVGRNGRTVWVDPLSEGIYGD